MELLAAPALFALHNGKPVTLVPLANRGMAYGDGLFETIKITDGRAQFLNEHLQRLERDCVRLGIYLDGIALRHEIALLLSAHRCGILKIIITRNAGMRGYAATPRATGERFLLFYPQSFSDEVFSHAGAVVRLCRQRLSEQPGLAGIKHLNRLEQVLARAEWSDPAIVEGLMLDQAGRLVEGTMSNVFLVRAGRVTTPRVHRCGVAGVVRDIVLQQLSRQCGAVNESDMTLDDLYAADEIFLTNSVMGIVPVRRVECIHKAVGDVTIAFKTAFAELVVARNYCQ